MGNILGNTIKVTSVCAMALTVLVGCNSNTKTVAQHCEGKSWYERGYEVGVEGGDARLLDRYLKKCDDAKNRENLRDYQKGFIVGIKKYCTYESGYKLGFSGDKNENLCPAEFREEFDSGYQLGRVDHLEQQHWLTKSTDGGSEETLTTADFLPKPEK